MSEETYEGIPRNKIPWDPKIDYEKCITCGKCVDFCHVGAFKFEEKNGEKKNRGEPKHMHCILQRLRRHLPRERHLPPVRRGNPKDNR